MVVAYSHIKRWVTPALLRRRGLRSLKQDAKRQGKADVRPDESYSSTTPLMKLRADTTVHSEGSNEEKTELGKEGGKEGRKKERRKEKKEERKKER